jgi:hypothetical protein
LFKKYFGKYKNQLKIRKNLQHKKISCPQNHIELQKVSLFVSEKKKLSARTKNAKFLIQNNLRFFKFIALDNES